MLFNDQTDLRKLRRVCKIYRIVNFYEIAERINVYVREVLIITKPAEAYF